MWDFVAPRMHKGIVVVVIALILSAPLEYIKAGAPSLSELAAKKEQLKKAHHQRSSSCFSCHKDTESASFKKVMKKSCVQCHKTGWVTGKLAELKHEPGMPKPQDNWPEAAGRGPGMQYEMYYSPSRLGNKPNEMKLVPGGEFIRGTNDRLPDEGPQHKMALTDFYLDVFEVTNLQYQYSLQFTSRKPPQHFSGGGVPQGLEDHPVVNVSWFDAKAYCDWAGKRLPDDKEWEKAARGTDGRTYPWGDEFDVNRVNSPVRWATLKLKGNTTPVGAFADGLAPYGHHDMSGNVWEWTSSRYEAYPGNHRKSENYGGNYRVLKGGSWWDCSFYQCGISAPVYNRSFFHPKTKNNSFGFRCAKDAN